MTVLRSGVHRLAALRTGSNRQGRADLGLRTRRSEVRWRQRRPCWRPDAVPRAGQDGRPTACHGPGVRVPSRDQKRGASGASPIPPQQRRMFRCSVQLARESSRSLRAIRSVIVRRHERRAAPGGEMHSSCLPFLTPRPPNPSRGARPTLVIMPCVGSAMRESRAISPGGWRPSRRGRTPRRPAWRARSTGTPMWLFRLPSVACTAKDFAEDGAQQFLGGRLAVAARESEDRARKALPVQVGEVLKGASAHRPRSRRSPLRATNRRPRRRCTPIPSHRGQRRRRNAPPSRRRTACLAHTGGCLW